MKSKDNVFGNLYPELVKEWNYKKNGDLTPFDVTSGSSKVVWWRCEKSHEWEARVYDRTRGRGCPYCSGRKVTEENSFAEKFPNLLKEWNYDKNTINPNEIFPKSNQKFWWKCNEGHEWKTTVFHRTMGTGCPSCKGVQKKMIEEIKEIAFGKGGEFLSKEYINSKTKMKWKCAKGHVWVAAPSTIMKGGWCPSCNTEKRLEQKALFKTHKNLIEEWNYEKNKDLDPKNITYGSHKKVWWKCPNGHEWEARIDSRSRGTKCPMCSNVIKRSDNVE